MMKKVGITGGIGAGKSTVCRIFQILGVPVYDADTRAKSLMNTDPNIIAGVRRLFGAESYSDGTLNRAFLAKVAFGDPQLLTKLNNLVHLAVAKDFKAWVMKQNAAYVIMEAALIFETRIHRDLDAVILITAALPIRIERVLARDAHRDRAQVLAIIDKQMEDKDKQQLADFCIHNDGRLILPEVLRLHQKLTA